MEYYRAVFDDLARLESFDVIQQILGRIVPVAPKIPEAYDIICYGYYKAKKYVEAAKYGELALATSDTPQAKTSIRFNLAKCYQYANEPEKAMNLLELNTRFAPYDIDSRIDYCVAVYAKGDKSKAGQMLREILKEPNLPEKAKKIVTFNLGTHDLREGNFKAGMKKLLSGRELTIWGSTTHKFPIPKWDGTPQPGKKILIIGEGGIGDEVINMRFAWKFREMGMIPSWASAHGLADFIEKCGWRINPNFDKLVKTGEYFVGAEKLEYENLINYKNFTTDIPTIKDYDYWTPGMDVPAMLGVDRDELWKGPYLSKPLLKAAPYKLEFPKAMQSAAWSSGIKVPLKVGLRWSGNPLYEQDLHRTIPASDIVKMLTESLQVPFEIYSFQRDDGVDKLHELEKEFPQIRFHDLSKSMKTFTDTAWLLSEMDFVISSCTSVAHVSAALGQDTFLVTPIMAYYTWAEETDKSPWYGDNLTLIRQDKPHDWSGAIEQLRHHMEKVGT